MVVYLPSVLCCTRKRLWWHDPRETIWYLTCCVFGLISKLDKTINTSYLKMWPVKISKASYQVSNCPSHWRTKSLECWSADSRLIPLTHESPVFLQRRKLDDDDSISLVCWTNLVPRAVRWQSLGTRLVLDFNKNSIFLSLVHNFSCA